MDTGHDTQAPRRTIRATHVLLSGVLAAAVIGFFVGLDDGVPGAEPAEAMPRTPPAAVSASGVVPAMSYREVAENDIGPNRNWASDLDKLARPDTDLFAPVTVSEQDKLASLADRARLRAYDGAPPVIPHSVHSIASTQCVACHQQSVRIGDATSPTIPHISLANCQQCHAAQSHPRFDSTAPVANTFAGVSAPVAGDRAWPGAPPTIPHSTLMRTDCMACHGPTGDEGMRTTHAWRTNCLQCHAPSAELDQRTAGVHRMRLPSPASASDLP